MKWYENLYVGESIVHKIAKVKWKIRHNAGQINIYVIAFPSNKENLLDIIPAQELMQKAYPKKDLFIIGIAKGYQEAIELAARIVLETYRNTGSFLVTEYLLNKKRECS